MPGFAIAGSRLQGHPWPWAAASLKSNSPCDCHLCVTCHSVSGPLPLAARKPKAKWCLAVGPVFFQFLAASAMEDLSCSSLCRCFPRSQQNLRTSFARHEFPQEINFKFADRAEVPGWLGVDVQSEASREIEFACWGLDHHEYQYQYIYIYVYLHILRCICNCRHPIMVWLDCSFQVAQPKGHGTYPGGQTGQDPAGTPDAVSDPVP